MHHYEWQAMLGLSKKGNTGVSLVLSSGGARGLAHIGVIEELLTRDFCINSVVGSSMGALVAGLYASGGLENFKNWAVGLSKLEMLSLVDFTLTSRGIIKGEKVFNQMQKLGLIPDINIEDLPIPFAAVAVDIINGKEVVFRSGSLLKAIRASIAIPSVFTPVAHEDGLLIDGGVLSPLPLQHATRSKHDLLVAVDVNSFTPYGKPIARIRRRMEQVDKPKLLKKWDAFNRQHKQPMSGRATQKGVGYLQLLTRSSLLMQAKLTQYAVGESTPDILVPISKDVSTAYEFYRANELIGFGRQRCAEVLDGKGL
jgi:NTE family protein